MYQLIIAEKPSVAQTIAAALGAKEKKDGYIPKPSKIFGKMRGHTIVGLCNHRRSVRAAIRDITSNRQLFL